MSEGLISPRGIAMIREANFRAPWTVHLTGLARNVFANTGSLDVAAESIARALPRDRRAETKPYVIAWLECVCAPALSLTQPWPWIIFNLGKRVENRSRNLGNWRGPVLIHASKKMTKHDWISAYAFVHDHISHNAAQLIPHSQSLALPRGVILGVAHITNQCEPGPAWNDTRPHEPMDWPEQKRWYTGAHAYYLERVRQFSCPVIASGALGFWKPPPEVLDALLHVTVR